MIISSISASPLTQPTVTLIFQSVSEISITDLMFHQLGIAFDNCTDISLTVLNIGSTPASAIAMTNVYGSVNISQFKHSVSDQAKYSIDMKWSVAHPPYSTSTHVMLQGINITGRDMKGMGVGISGCLHGDVLLKDSIFSGLGLAFSSNLSFACYSSSISHEGMGRSIFSPALCLHNVSYECNKKAVVFDSARNAIITDCIFEGMKDGAVFAVNSVITVKGSTVFTGNTGHDGGAIKLRHNNTLTLQDATTFIGNVAQSKGGAIFVYENNTISLKDNVNLSSNTAADGGAVYLDRSNAITIRGFVEFTNNNGRNGGGINTFRNNIIKLRGNALLAGNTADIGGAVYLDKDNAITIQGSVELSNNTALYYGGAINLYKDNSITIMGNVALRVNKALVGGGIFMGPENTIIVKDDVTFTNNAAIEAGGAVFLDFQNDITLFGSASFRHNTAAKGGAIALVDSFIHLPLITEVHILFENNTAQEMGGALFFFGFKQFLVKHCSIKLAPLNMTAHAQDVLIFIENTAISGDAMYGAYLDSNCSTAHHRAGQQKLITNLSEVIRKTSFFSPSFIDDLSLISSDPIAVRFCNKDRMPICFSNTTFNISVYPGQLFQVPVVTVGDMCGVVSAPILATVGRQYSAKLGNELQYIQTTNSRECSSFQYSILTNLTGREYVLTLSVISSVFIHIVNTTVQTNVLVLGCPEGFTLTGLHCDCDLRLMLTGAVCNITERSIVRRSTTWIGAFDNGSSLVFSPVCPLGYCKNEEVKLILNQTLIDEDSQCTANRSGILCGHCKDNFSLALGSNRCLPNCNYNSLSLIAAFIFAGIMLVFFIKILNLTVSQGTLNGLIFYANIIWANKLTVFPNSQEIGLLNFLAIFIAWVNLDLGIETCFLYGMDGTTKAWLQFVFPVYIWAIAFFIIVLSHYSVRASRLFGNNSVHVLATLILLSYSKMLRAIVSAISLARIQFLDGSKMLVWERDGNIRYLTGEHIPLFAIALAVLVLLLFPFTLILFSIQWLQRGTHFRVLRWVTKLMPFFEAFTGPLKYQHRYWVGLLLFVRCILLLVFSTATRHKFTASLSSIAIALFILQAISCSPYRNTYLTVLEKSYILNLGLLSTGTLYIRYSTSGNQEVLTITSVGIVFLQFVATVVYHCCVRLRDPVKRLVTKIREKEDVQEVTNNEGCGFEPFEVSDQQPLIQSSYQIIDGRPGRDKNGDHS